MSYTDFLDLIGNAFTLFIDTLTRWSNVLIHNYFFITILGSVLFCSFIIWCIDNLVYTPLSSKLSSIEDKINKYNQYDLYQDIRYSWYQNNRVKVYNMAYDRYTVNRNVGQMYSDNLAKINKQKVDSLHNNPEWLYKDIVKEPITPEEEKELTDIIDNF